MNFTTTTTSVLTVCTADAPRRQPATNPAGDAAAVTRTNQPPNSPVARPAWVVAFSAVWVAVRMSG